MKKQTENKYLNGTHLNTLNRLYKEETQKEWGKRPVITVDVSRFKGIDRLESGRNRVGRVVQLLTTSIEVNRVYWLNHRKFKPTLYVNAVTKSEHGFGSQDQCVLFVFKNVKGHKEYLRLNKTWNKEDFETSDRIMWHLNKTIPLKYKNRPWSVRNEWENRLKMRFRDEFYSSMYHLEDGRIPEDLTKLLKAHGITPIEAVPYTHEFNMYGVKYIKADKLNLELGQMNASTYNSLPSIIEIKVSKKGPNLLSLNELGIEERGYYDHTDKMLIKSSDLKKVKSFQSKFKRGL